MRNYQRRTQTQVCDEIIQKGLTRYDTNKAIEDEKVCL